MYLADSNYLNPLLQIKNLWARLGPGFWRMRAVGSESSTLTVGQ
jgi:hypothetical protein